jgi:hypothetical protein
MNRPWRIWAGIVMAATSADRDDVKKSIIASVDGSIDVAISDLE